ncbi:MAG TPA: hypothetical protein VGB69_02500 [Edaphobacter sp.]
MKAAGLQRIFPAMIAVVLCCLSLSAFSQVKALPMQTHLAEPTYPRVSGLSPKAAEDRVNALLVEREKQDRSSRKECLKSGPHASYDESIRTTYLSSRLLSLDVRASWDGCSAYPNDNLPNPLTVDLNQGKEIDWPLFFRPGFLQAREGQSSPLLRLYLRHVKLDGECLDVVKEPGMNFLFWLDSKKGLIAVPSLPHVVQACAEEAEIPFAEIKDAIRDPQIRADLLAASSQAVPATTGKTLP